MTLASLIAVRKKDLLQQSASPREVCESPANLFVAGVMGSPPMNFLPAIATPTKDGARARPVEVEGGPAVLAKCREPASRLALKRLLSLFGPATGVRP